MSSDKTGIFSYSALAGKLFMDTRTLDKIFKMEEIDGTKVPAYPGIFNKTRIYNMSSVEYIANKYKDNCRKYWEERKLEDQAIKEARERLQNKKNNK